MKCIMGVLTAWCPKRISKFKKSPQILINFYTKEHHLTNSWNIGIGIGSEAMLGWAWVVESMEGGRTNHLSTFIDVQCRCLNLARNTGKSIKRNLPQTNGRSFWCLEPNCWKYPPYPKIDSTFFLFYFFEFPMIANEKLLLPASVPLSPCRANLFWAGRR